MTMIHKKTKENLAGSKVALQLTTMNIIWMGLDSLYDL